MIMRDTVFCAISPEASRDAITASVHAMVTEVSRYVPGYALRADPHAMRHRFTEEQARNVVEAATAKIAAKLGIAAGVDVDAVLAAAEDMVRPIIPRLDVALQLQAEGPARAGARS